MNEMTPSAAPGNFFGIWIRALTKPNESTYAELAGSPRAKASTAFLWVFVCSIAPAIINALTSGSRISALLEQAGVEAGQGGAGAALINLFCFAPFGAVFYTLLFIVGVALMNWIAGMFGGKGTFEQLAYTLGAIAAPGLLVSAVINLPSFIPVLGICSGLLGFLFSLYLIYLEVTAIKAVHGFGWGQAIGTFFIPGLALALVLCCLLFAVASIFGMAFSDVFSTMNQSLPQF